MSATTIAIYQLDPDAKFSFENGNESYENVVWSDLNKTPSKIEFDNTVKRIKFEIELAECQDKRKVEYPNIGDQLDALFKAGVFPPEMAAQIQAVKDKYPKPATE